jgi:hypothetical protein
MKKEDLNQMIHQHLERYNNFDAALELLGLAIAELKKAISDMQDGADRTKEINQLKKVFEAILKNKLSEKELIVLESSIHKYIDLCNLMLK